MHADFANYPYFPMPFNAYVLSLLNGVIKFFNILFQRKALAKSVKHKIVSLDGTLINVFQFNPDKTLLDNAGSKKLPAIVYYHGGAFVLGYLPTHIASMNMYAQRAHCAVFMVDYRLAPKYVFPKGFEDCYAALQWVSSNASKLGIDETKIAVAGDSAGGCLAAAVAQKAADKKASEICGQLLIYPVLDKDSKTVSATQFVNTPSWNSVGNRRMWEVYLKNYNSNDIPTYAAPADKKDLSGLVPAYIENAEFDPLRDEAEAYSMRLQAAGVRTVFNATKGTVHGYDTAFHSAISKHSMQQRLDFLKSIFC